MQYNTLREENSAVQYTGRRIIVKSDILQEDNGAVYNTMRMIAQYIYIEEEEEETNQRNSQIFRQEQVRYFTICQVRYSDKSRFDIWTIPDKIFRQ